MTVNRAQVILDGGPLNNTYRVGHNHIYIPYMTVYLYRIYRPYIYTVYDRIFGDFPAKINVHTPCI
jgi:hypothetical protein